MTNDAHLNLPEALRSYLVEFAPLPVLGGAFSLDGLQPGESMSLQFNGGVVISTFIDDTQVWDQPFTLFFRGSITDDNDTKSQMLGALNAIGTWLTQAELPYLGEGVKVLEMGQVQLANIAEREDDKSITYQAGYRLVYETV